MVSKLQIYIANISRTK